MKETLTRVRRMLWWREGKQRAKPRTFTVAEPLQPLKAMDEYVASLDPKTPAQKQFRGRGGDDASAMEQTRLAHLAATGESGFLAAGGDRGVVGADPVLRLRRAVAHQCDHARPRSALGAFAVGSALFLILELSQPFTGVFRSPPAPIDQMLESLDRSGALARPPHAA